ncbi:CPXCG motif-containing cysteine-rich protein, partial [Gammaproteobacteria bacterium]|nr:CPXCG motif-containing cysteine-rich protein [Gammaproteobacteria bacterium]
CPYCGEKIELVIDCSIPEQSYIEDCEVCCRPISLSIVVDEKGRTSVSYKHENE